MNDNGDWFYKIVASIRGSASTAERWNSFSRQLSDLGFDQINYGILDPSEPDSADASVLFLSTMRPDWIEYYGAKRLDRDDPHVRLVREGNLRPYLWEESQIARVETDEGKKVLATAGEAGLRGQLQVTFTAGGGKLKPVAGMALGSSMGAAEFRKLVKGHEAKLVTAAHLFHQSSYGAIRRSREGIASLSERERDCLSYIAAGDRIDRVAERLGLARVTVELHLKRARQKLKATTVTHAVAKALFYGEISYK